MTKMWPDWKVSRKEREECYETKETPTQSLRVTLIHTKQDAERTDKIHMRTFAGLWWITEHFSLCIGALNGGTSILSSTRCSGYLVYGRSTSGSYGLDQKSAQCCELRQDPRWLGVGGNRVRSVDCYGHYIITSPQ